MKKEFTCISTKICYTNIKYGKKEVKSVIEVMRKAVRLFCIAILCLSFVVSDVALAGESTVVLANQSDAFNRFVAATSAKTIYVEGAMKLPYTDKFEFLKSAIRKPFAAVSTGYIRVAFFNVRNTEESRSKLHVRVYYRAAKKNKWIKGSHEAFWITNKSVDNVVFMNVPKGRPFYIRLYKTNNKTIPTKGRIRIEKYPPD